jgi:molecular chaperone DnaK
MIFTTISDNQQTVKIHVLQGEREIASENKSLGYFNLVGIPLAPKGIPQIEVTFEIDANGMVVVSAIDKQTSLSQSMKVQPAGGLSPEEIKKIIEEAKQFAEKDRNFLRLNELRSNLKEEYSSVAFFVDRYSDKISEEERSYIDEILLQVDEIIDSDDIRELSKLYKKLSDIRLKINMIIMAEFED